MQENMTTQSLMKATIVSALLASVALLIIILPAEYNIDPTGVGRKLGLTVFSEPASVPVSADNASTGEREYILITVPANKGIEYKFIMNQYAKLEYEWLTDGTALYHDLHGEPEGDTTGYYESFTIATASEMKGSFTTPFHGSHGWYFKNETDAPVQVQLIVKGDYSSHALKQ